MKFDCACWIKIVLEIRDGFRVFLDIKKESFDPNQVILDLIIKYKLEDNE